MDYIHVFIWFECLIYYSNLFLNSFFLCWNANKKNPIRKFHHCKYFVQIDSCSLLNEVTITGGKNNTRWKLWVSLFNIFCKRARWNVCTVIKYHIFLFRTWPCNLFTITKGCWNFNNETVGKTYGATKFWVLIIDYVRHFNTKDYLQYLYQFEQTYYKITSTPFSFDGNLSRLGGNFFMAVLFWCVY